MKKPEEKSRDTVPLGMWLEVQGSKHIRHHLLSLTFFKSGNHSVDQYFSLSIKYMYVKRLPFSTLYITSANFKICILGVRQADR
jgi:hypothetical protein